jgi:aromatic ring hydroxylase
MLDYPGSKRQSMLEVIWVLDHVFVYFHEYRIVG